MEKLKAKDLILIGVFTVLLYVISLLVAFVGITPIGSMLASAVYALISAPVFMLYIIKIKKPFALIISGIFCSIMGLLSFPKIIIALIVFACFVLADIIAKIGKYKNFKFNTISYMIFSLWTIGINGAYWYLQDFMVQHSLAYGMEQTWLDEMINLATPLNFILMVALTLLAGFIGSLFAKIMLKKHFIKAGVVEK